MITFGSVCSGIEGASVAWYPLGWKCEWVSELEAFPCAVLKHHYSDVPNLGDMTLLPVLMELGMMPAPDVLVGGTPCQSFSLAGLRKGLDDARGQLTYSYVELFNAIDEQRIAAGKPECICVWENVPGILSDKTNAFGCLLAGLVGETEPLVSTGKRWSDAGYVSGPQRSAAWIVLDAQYFGVAQRRRRVFVVASARAGFNPFEVLFKWDGVRRDIAPSREAGESTSYDVAPCVDSSGVGFSRTGDKRGQDPVVAHTLKADGFDASEDGTGRGTPLVPCYWDGGRVSQTLDAVLQKGQTLDAVLQKGQTLDAVLQKGQTMPEKNRFTAVLVPDVMPIMTSGPNTEAGHSARSGHCKDNYIMPVAIPINMQSAIKNGGKSPNGTGIVEDGDPANTLGAGDWHAVAFHYNAQVDQMKFEENVTAPMTTSQGDSYTLRGREGGGTAELSEIPSALRASKGGGDKAHVLTNMLVRRLVPSECEILQGFPKFYTRIPMRFYKTRRITKLRPEDVWDKVDGGWNLMSADGVRYKSLGNSFAVPVISWIGKRIQQTIEHDCKDPFSYQIL